MLVYEKYVKENKEEFLTKVIKISAQLGISPQWLMGAMFIESSLNHRAVNEKTLAYGLIQIMPDTLKDKRFGGITYLQLTRLNNVQQLDYVYKYFLPYKKNITKFEDLYLITLYPNAINDKTGKHQHAHTLEKPDDWVFPENVSKQNPDITREANGQLTIRSVKKWLKNRLVEMSYEIHINETITVNRQQSEDDTKKKLVVEGDITYVHTYSAISTLQDLIKYKGWFDYENKREPLPDEILNHAGNLQSIQSTYTSDELEEFKGEEKDNLPLGVKLQIPSKYIREEFVVFDGQQNIVPKDDTETFISEALLASTKSPSYSLTSSLSGTVTKKIVPKPRVWIWCRSLGLSNDENLPRFSTQGEIFDLTPFITNLNVNHSKNGGNFSFNLAPLTCECEIDGWVLKYTSDSSGTNFIASDKLTNKIGRFQTRNSFLFHNMISENDVVFITMDSDYPVNLKNPKIPLSELPGKYYDLIGLVDKNSVKTNANSNVSIAISGRDLVKLFIEDSAYILNLDEQGGLKQGVIKNDNPENWGRPMRKSKLNVTSPILALSVAQPRTVGEMLSFIFSTLATTEIVPDKVFKYYESQEEGFGISKYTFFDAELRRNVLFNAAGIWQIIKLQIDPENVNDRYVVDSTLAVHSGSLTNAIKTFIDDRFIEILFDTYKDQFFCVVRRPPYNWKSVVDYLDKLATSDDSDLIITEDEVVEDDLSWYDEDVYAWYRINTSYVSFGVNRDVYQDSLPVVYFREYCEIYGNKGLDIMTNYLPFLNVPLNPHQNENDFVLETQRYEDLAYLVETNAYLPFTRKGTITIKSKRGIKRGTWIRYVPTKEIFYVESVSHMTSTNFNSTEYTSTLVVSRGMVESTASGQYILPYYFKIIDGLYNTDSQIQEQIIDEFELQETQLMVYFDFDKSEMIVVQRDDLSIFDLSNSDVNQREELRNKGVESLNQVVQQLKDNPDLEITCTGHTDLAGGEKYNMVLGLKRARFVKDNILEIYKKNFGEDLNPSRIKTISMGETQPIEVDSAGITGVRNSFSKNRRVEITYTIKVLKKNKNSSNADANKKNDYSKWRVNQEIFNMFVCRKQTCFKIDDLESVGLGIKKQKPTDLVTEPILNNQEEKDNSIKEYHESKYDEIYSNYKINKEE